MNKDKTRFDLEQEIMEAWRVVDDLKLYLDKYEEMTEDQRMNIMIGMITMYDLKFNVLFDTFEQCLRKREFGDSRWPATDNPPSYPTDMGNTC